MPSQRADHLNSGQWTVDGGQLTVNKPDTITSCETPDWDYQSADYQANVLDRLVAINFVGKARVCSVVLHAPDSPDKFWVRKRQLSAHLKFLRQDSRANSLLFTRNRHEPTRLPPGLMLRQH